MDPFCIAQRVKHPSFANRNVAIHLANTVINGTVCFRKKALNKDVLIAFMLHPVKDVRLAGIGLVLITVNHRAKVPPYP